MSTEFYAYKRPFKKVVIYTLYDDTYTIKYDVEVELKVEHCWYNDCHCVFYFKNKDDAYAFILLFADYDNPVAREVGIGQGKTRVDILDTTVRYAVSEYGEPVFIENGKIIYEDEVYRGV